MLWAGLSGALAFPAIFLLSGWLRADYSSLRHTVSALATGSPRWLQTASFVLCGLAITLGAVGVAQEGRLLLAVTIGVFGIALVLSGVFPMDPMRGYPAGTPQEDPDDLSTSHRLHDLAGAVVFFGMPVMPVVMALSSTSWTVSVLTVLLAIGLGAGVAGFSRAWERDDPRTGLVQKVTLAAACLWLAATFAAMA